MDKGGDADFLIGWIKINVRDVKLIVEWIKVGDVEFFVEWVRVINKVGDVGPLGSRLELLNFLLGQRCNSCRVV